MTVVVTHNFVSAKTDGADNSLVQPSNWGNAATNAAGSTHTITGLGTVVSLNTGTSGNTVPVLNAVGNTWANAQTFTTAPVFTDAAGTRSALGIANNVCSVYMSSDQTVTAAVSTKLHLNTTIADPHSWFDTTTNYRFTPTVAGNYFVSGIVSSASISGDSPLAQIRKNGSAIFYGSITLSTVVGTTRSVVVGVISMNGSTDYLELWGYFPVTTAYGASANTSFSAFKVSD